MAYLTKTDARVVYTTLLRGIAKILRVRVKDLPSVRRPHANDPTVQECRLTLDSPIGRIDVTIYGGDRWSGYHHKYDVGWIHVRFHEPLHALLVLKTIRLGYPVLNIHNGKWNWHIRVGGGKYTSREYRDSYVLPCHVLPFLAAFAELKPWWVREPAMQEVA